MDREDFSSWLGFILITAAYSIGLAIYNLLPTGHACKHQQFPCYSNQLSAKYLQITSRTSSLPCPNRDCQGHVVIRFFSLKQYKPLSLPLERTLKAQKIKEFSLLNANIPYWIESISGLSDCAVLAVRQPRQGKSSRTSKCTLLDDFVRLCYFIDQCIYF